MIGEFQPRIRILGRRPAGDAAWDDLLDAARFWRSHGAPYRIISQMIADDYGVALDEESIRQLLTGQRGAPPAGS